MFVLRDTRSLKAAWIIRFLSLALTGCENLNQVVQYAQKYRNNYNPNYQNFGGNNAGFNNTGGDDCTNFVSQAMAAGGEGWVGFPQPITGGDSNSTNDSAWYMVPLNQQATLGNLEAVYTNSWTVVHDWLTFNLGGPDPAVPRAKIIGSFYYDGGVNKAPANPANMVPGDVFAYNWDGFAYSGLSHLTIEVKDDNSTDVWGYTGTEVDSHDANLKNVFWSLKDAAINAHLPWQYIKIVFIQNVWAAP
jgi:hypothetical protein